MTVDLGLDNGRLRAVPSVHFRFAFAETVSNLCRDESTRPKAVAVELGPGAVAAITDCMRDLGVGPRKPRTELPCMLGLIRRNKLIHPKFMQQAIRLQEIHGKPLQRIPPHVLSEELQMPSLSLICLSATDSIIEAIRSAIEREIPIYGVDLEDFAYCNRQDVLIEDPLSAQENVCDYVDRNAEHAKSSRDDWVDARREQYIAAGLRYLVQKHEDVLFVGGLAHWTELVRLLTETSPAMELVSSQPDAIYERVVVDPNIAVRFMDIFPEFTREYEHRRGTVVSRLEVRDMVVNNLRAAYQNAAGSIQFESNPQDFIGQYFNYLSNLCLMNQRAVPDLFLSISAADMIISRQFAEKLGESLIAGAAQDIGWLKPENFPNLQYLKPLALDQIELKWSKKWTKAELIGPHGKNGPHFVAGSDQDHPFGPEASPIPIDSELMESWESRARSESEDSGDSDHSPNSWVWPPCENLFYGTAYKAAEVAFTRREEGIAIPFEGVLHQGLDCKASVRAAARGDGRLFVRMRTMRRNVSQKEALSEPFVYIFDRVDATQHIRPTWGMTQGGRSLGEHIRPAYRQHYDSVVQREGKNFIAGVYYFEERDIESRLAGCNYFSGMHLLWGAMAFGNPCLNSIQSARWIEEGNFRCCPVLRWASMDDLIRLYKDKHGIELDKSNWPETLIRIAIQYARNRVVVIAPDFSVLSQLAKAEARARKISLDFHPLSYFSTERIAGIRKLYHVYPKDQDATQWPDEVVRLLRQKPDEYFDLLPPFIRAQTVENG